jgi:hypothetical protein
LKPKDRLYIIIASILIHIFLFLIWDTANFFNLFDSKKPVIPIIEPIVFDLRTEKTPKQVIETPDNKTNKKPKKAKLLSDKNSIAKNNVKNNVKNKNLKIDDPYFKGDYKSYEIPKPSGNPIPLKKQINKINKKKKAQKQEKKKKDLRDYLPKKKIEELLNKKMRDVKKTPQVNQGISKKRRLILHNNILSKSLDMGGLSFNTYNWEFAPYMLMLKSIIQNNIFPPLAFTKLGLINGVTLIKFRIYPNGELKYIKVLAYKGHKSLMTTSYNSIKISAPFPKLPKNFPEKYLEVTGKFVYIIRGKKQ